MASAKEAKVTRISAKDAPKKATSASLKKSSKVKNQKSKTPKVRKAPTNSFIKTLFAIGGYFKGAWTELRLVRWPTRKATWGLTIAVILFSTFFVVLISLLDILFKYLFELVLR